MSKTICVAGKNEIGVKALYAIKNRYPQHKLVAIPNKTDPGYNHWQPSLIFHARQLGIPVLNLEDVYGIQDLVFISLEFDSLLRPARFLSQHLFNIHFSALPRYKGMYTSIHPLLNGEPESGVTLHCIDPGIDTGDIIDQITFPLGPKTTGRELYQLYLDHSFTLLEKNLDSLVGGTWTAKVQDSQNASYYAKSSINFADIRIDLQKTAWEIANQFRAFHFREYQMPQFQGWEIASTQILSEKSSGKAGTILEETQSHFRIATIDFSILLIKDYYSVFWNSAQEGNLEQVQATISHIPDINLRNRQGWNALILAIYNGHLDVVQYLLEKGADRQVKNFKGTNLTMYGLGRYEKTGDDDMLRFLIGQGFDLTSPDDTGKSILDYAKDDHARNLILNGLGKNQSDS